MFKRRFHREAEEPSYLNLYGEELDLPFFFRYEYPLHFFKELPLDDAHKLPVPHFSEEKPRHEVRLGWSYDGIACRVFYPKKTFKPGVDGDAIELFFDTRDQQDAPYPTRFCHHFLLFPEPIQGIAGREVTRFRGDETHPHADPNLFEVSTKSAFTGTYVDIFIPKDAFFGFDPNQFNRIGFSYRISQEGALPESLVSSKELASLPSLWSTLVLVK